MKEKFVLLFLLLYPCFSFANLDLITWKGTYYQEAPSKKGITEHYCKEHSPGTFIHVVKNALIHPIITDKKIKLDHASFSVDKLENMYLIHGSFLATGKSKGIQWQDHIYYFLYKYTEAGTTKGIWYSDKCKGLYKGIAINIKNFKHIKESLLINHHR